MVKNVVFNDIKISSENFFELLSVDTYGSTCIRM